MQFCAPSSPEDVIVITSSKRAVTFRTLGDVRGELLHGQTGKEGYQGSAREVCQRRSGIASAGLIQPSRAQALEKLCGTEHQQGVMDDIYRLQIDVALGVTADKSLPKKERSSRAAPLYLIMVPKSGHDYSPDCVVHYLPRIRGTSIETFT
jgi:hypothetical protein